MASALENQKALVEKIVQAEESWDLDRIISLRTADATFQILPQTMDWPMLKGAEFKERMGPLVPVFAGRFKVRCCVGELD